MDILPVKEQTALPECMLSSTFDIAGYETIKSFGVVRGITVRSQNLCATICSILCSFGGGKSHFFTRLCEMSRVEAHKAMGEQARHLGANAVIGVTYDSNDILNGVTECLAYGPAVFVVKKPLSGLNAV